MTETVPAAFAAAVRRDPTVPLLTFYDDGSGDRTELSGATLANWVAKTANLLVDGAGLGHGDTATVLLPPHWQTAAILLGAWSAGLAVGPGGDVVFASPAGFDAAPQAGDRYATGLLPLAMPLRELPPGWADYTLEVRQFGDYFTPVQPVAAADPALGDRAHGELPATQRAAELGITPGSRVLIDAATHADPVDWLLAPLYAGASIVLCANLDRSLLEKRAAMENVTLTLA